MAKVTAQQWGANWSQALANKTQKIQQGIAQVQTAPGQKAAAKASAMLAGVTQAVTSGRWAAAVSSVSLSDWQQATTAKVGNIATGAAAAVKTQKFNAAITQMLSDNDAALAAIASMPSDTSEQRMQRALAFMQARRDIAMQRGK